MLDDRVIRVSKMKALLSKLKSSEIMKSKRINIPSSANSLNKSTDIKAKTAIKPFAL